MKREFKIQSYFDVHVVHWSDLKSRTWLRPESGREWELDSVNEQWEWVRKSDLMSKYLIDAFDETWVSMWHTHNCLHITYRYQLPRIAKSTKIITGEIIQIERQRESLKKREWIVAPDAKKDEHVSIDEKRWCYHKPHSYPREKEQQQQIFGIAKEKATNQPTNTYTH